MRPPSAVGMSADDVTSPLSCHSPLAVTSNNPAHSANSTPTPGGNPSSYFNLPLIKDEDLASVGSAASNQGGILTSGGDPKGGGNDLDADSKLVDSIEYESILEAEENYKELVEREWQQSR